MKRTMEAEFEPMPGVASALQRAAHRARLIAAQTNTPLVLSTNGKIELRWVSLDYLRREARAGRREDFEHYLSAVPDNSPPESDRSA